MVLHFHGDFQDGVLRPLIKIIERTDLQYIKSDLFPFSFNVAIIVLLILIRQINVFSVCLNFFVKHLHMVTISRLMSNSRSNAKISKKANWSTFPFGFETKFT